MQLNPQHPLALAAAKKSTPPINDSASGTSGPPSHVQTGPGDASIPPSEISGGTFNFAQARTILTQLEQGAQGDEARTVIKEIRKSMGLN